MQPSPIDTVGEFYPVLINFPWQENGVPEKSRQSTLQKSFAELLIRVCTFARKSSLCSRIENQPRVRSGLTPKSEMMAVAMRFGHD